MTTENNSRKGFIYSALKFGITSLPRPFRQAMLTRIIHAQPEGVRQAIKVLLDELEIDRVVQESAARFQELKNRRGMKVHLGCGDDVKPGWINIDLRINQNMPQYDQTQPDTIFINHDLRLGLPLEDGSCDYIYSSHFFEHLEYKHGLHLMRESYRVLRPGGVFRISLPNYKGFFEAYLRGDRKYIDILDINELLPELEPGTETYVDYVNYGVYTYGEHKCIYDEEKVILILRKLGYSSVVESSYQEGVDPGTELRRRYSFYVEAVK